MTVTVDTTVSAANLIGGNDAEAVALAEHHLAESGSRSRPRRWHRTAAVEYAAKICGTERWLSAGRLRLQGVSFPLA